MTIEQQYPLMFNNDVLKYPDSFNIEEQTIETVNQTEAGTDQVQLVRIGKIKISVSHLCLADELILYKNYSTLSKFTLKYYDPSLNGYATKTVRMRELKYPLSKGSYRLDGVRGVYSVSFTLEEF